MTENGNGVNHANVKQYGDLMKIIGSILLIAYESILSLRFLGHQFIDSLNSRRVNAWSKSMQLL